MYSTLTSLGPSRIEIRVGLVDISPAFLQGLEKFRLIDVAPVDAIRDVTMVRMFFTGALVS